MCIRLYEEDDFALRAPFTDPEILRASLASVILRMKALKLDDIEEFPFVEAPPGRAIADGYHLLQELGAIDDSNTLTPVGPAGRRARQRLPVRNADHRVGAVRARPARSPARSAGGSGPGARQIRR
ncbi:ATP-dependent helicase HrpA [Mycobacteroides abscessus subsp. abscessus]|nr:ATP-dependent helicase HrpA [Mycobacteroides abscessus subsp. abscessus]